MSDIKENMMNDGTLAKIRALDTNGNSIIIDLLSVLDQLTYRGEVKSFNEDAINKTTSPGLYNHGAGLYGTGDGWHGILIVLKARPCTVQIDIP